MGILSAVLLAALLMGLPIVLRIRRRRLRPTALNEEGILANESMFAAAPATRVEVVQSRQTDGTSPGHTLFSDRLVGGTVAALLLAGIVFALEVTGLGGPLGVILAMPLASLPLVEAQLGSLFAGMVTVALIAFALGFAYPRLVNRIV